LPRLVLWIVVAAQGALSVPHLQLDHFVGCKPAATDRHAALVQACRVIFNLNEFVYPN
jgi:hypothetical protein